MIIVDGPDNMGKTTLINKLANELSYPVRGFGQEIQDCSAIQLAEEIAADIPEVIYDRFHMSNFVYGKICRKSNKVTARHCRAINEGLTADKHAFTILLIPKSLDAYCGRLRDSDLYQDYDEETNMRVAECFIQHADYMKPDLIIKQDNLVSAIEVHEILTKYFTMMEQNTEPLADDELAHG